MVVIELDRSGRYFVACSDCRREYAQASVRTLRRKAKEHKAACLLVREVQIGVLEAACPDCDYTAGKFSRRLGAVTALLDHWLTFCPARRQSRVSCDRCNVNVARTGLKAHQGTRKCESTWTGKRTQNGEIVRLRLMVIIETLLAVSPTSRSDTLKAVLGKWNIPYQWFPLGWNGKKRNKRGVFVTPTVAELLRTWEGPGLCDMEPEEFLTATFGVRHAV